MLVRCDNCGQKYDVDDARLSPQGARIKCQNCAQIIVVRLPNSETRKPSTTEVTVDNPVFEDPQLLTQVGSPEAPVSGIAEPVSEGVAPWRVRHMGLTYTFHDIQSLRDWLSSRQSLVDIKLDQNETGWGEIGDFPDVLTTEMITKFFPLGDVPTTKACGAKTADAMSPVNELPKASTAPSITGMAPASSSADLSKPVSVSRKTAKNIKREKLKAEKDKQAMKNKMIGLGILAVVLIVAVIVGLRFVKSGEILPGMNKPAPAEEVAQTADSAEPEAPAEVKAPEKQAEPAPAPEKRDSGADEDKPKVPSVEELEKLAQEDIQKRFDEASALVKDKKWPEARATLETLVREKPENIEMLTLLSKTYKGLNLKDKAAEVDAEIKRLKSIKK